MAIKRRLLFLPIAFLAMLTVLIQQPESFNVNYLSTALEHKTGGRQEPNRTKIRTSEKATTTTTTVLNLTEYQLKILRRRPITAVIHRPCQRGRHPTWKPDGLLAAHRRTVLREQIRQLSAQRHSTFRSNDSTIDHRRALQHLSSIELHSQTRIASPSGRDWAFGIPVRHTCVSPGDPERPV